MVTNRDLKRRYGLSIATIRFLKKLGYLRDTSGNYDFKELSVIRTLGALQAADVSTRAIHHALTHLKPWLSERLSVTRLSLRACDKNVRICDGTAFWEPASGQYGLPLEVDRVQSNIINMTKRKKTPKAIDNAHDHYLRGADLESNDAIAAREAYEACIKGDCTHMNARINLGRLLHQEGKHREAEVVYRAATDADAVLLFNLGVLLEDQGRPDDAACAYRDALAHDPGMADAHFNLALLHEHTGETQAAFRHLLAYRRLSHIRVSLRREARK